MIKKIFLSLFLSFFVLGFLGVCFVLAWNEPTSPPPQDNVDAPINVGTISQVKNAKISATEFGDSNDPFFYVNPNGTSILAGPVAIGGDDTPDFRLESVGSAANGYFGISNTGEGDILKIDSSGNVGIGTVSPNYPLEVQTSSSARTGYFKNTSPGVIVGVYGETDNTNLQYAVYGKAHLNTINNWSVYGVFGEADSDDSAGIQADAVGGKFNAYADDCAYGVYGYAESENGPAFGVYGVAYGTPSWSGLFGDGNVYIQDSLKLGGSWASAPVEIVEINGGIKLGTAANTNDGTIQWTGADFEGRKAGAWVSLTGTGGTPVGPGNLDYLAKWDNLGGDNLGNSIIFDNGTNVGIGANDPQYKLDVNGDLRVRGDEPASSAPIGDIYAPAPLCAPQCLSALRFNTSDEFYFYLDEEGDSDGALYVFDDRDNDLIGGLDILFSVLEASPAAPVGMYGIVSLPTWSRMAIGDKDPDGIGDTEAMLEIMPSAGTDYLALSTTDAPANTGNILMVKNNGNVGIGTNSPGAYKLNVAGEAYCSGTAPCWNEPSSRELKENIAVLSDEQLEAVLQELNNTPVYFYNYKDDAAKETQLGVIAEDSPGWITNQEKTTVGASAIANFTLAAVKAQQQQIEELKLENENLKQRIEALERLMQK